MEINFVGIRSLCIGGMIYISTLLASDPVPDCGLEGPKLFGEFLYLRAQNAGFRYAMNNYGVNAIDASILRPKFCWEPGGRVGVGYNLPYDGWDLEASWTSYLNESKDSASAPSANVATNTGILMSFFGLGPYQSASGKWNLHFNMIDISIGKRLPLTPAFSFRVSGGMNGGWIYQRFISRADGPTDPSGLPVIFSARDRFCGIGPEAALDAFYKLGKGFSLTGSGTGSLLYGQVRTRQKARHLISGSYVADVKYKDRYFDLEPALKLDLGFSWEYCFAKSQSSLTLAAGWESQYWWDQYHIFALAPTNDIPSFSTHAVTLEGVYFKAEGSF